MNNRKVSDIFRVAFLPLFSIAILGACSTSFEEEWHYKDIEQPFKETFIQDTIAYGMLNLEQARHILSLDESNNVVTDRSKRSFKVNELFQVRATSLQDSIRITSYSAKTVYDVTMEIYLEEFDMYIPVVHMDSIPGFSQFEFKPLFIGKRITYKKPDGNFISFDYPFFEIEKLKPRLISEDKHFQMLSKIDAQWDIYFSNYSWTPEQGDGGDSWRELRAIYAREWVVIMTNYAYIMTTPEYQYVMTNFNEIFSGDLCDNSRNSFDADKYQSELLRFKQPHTFALGMTGPAVSGLGGGSTLGVSHYNFYGHYGSFSGWYSIAHEFMHCMGYSHDSNMTYAQNGVGWTSMISQLHTYLRGNDLLPYTDRNLLGFHKPENATYRNGGVTDTFVNDDTFKREADKYYNSSTLVQHLIENPIKK